MYCNIFCICFPECFTSFAIYKFVANSVKSIRSDTMFFVILCWDSISICFCRHCLMKCRIQHPTVSSIWEKFSCHADTTQITWVVQWRKRSKVFYNFFYLIVNNGRFYQFFSSMNNSMANSFDIIWIRNHPYFSITK